MFNYQYFNRYNYTYMIYNHYYFRKFIIRLLNLVGRYYVERSLVFINTVVFLLNLDTQYYIYYKNRNTYIFLLITY